MCNISEAKKSFYRSFNTIFGRVGRIAGKYHSGIINEEMFANIIVRHGSVPV